MKPVRLSFIVALAILWSAMLPSWAQPVANQAVSVVDLKSVPNGNYILSLELEGQMQRVNLQVENNRAKCVNSSDPKLRTLQGQFQLKGNGVFLALLQAGAFRTSQIWIFRADGAVAVREVPDRGEQESAVPVQGNSTEIPKKK